MTNTKKIVEAVLRGFGRQFVDAGDPLQPHVIQMASEFIDHEHPEIAGNINATRIFLLEQKVEELERRVTITIDAILKGK